MNSSTLQDRRVWIGGGAFVALVLIAASWFLLISPELSDASSVRAQATNTNTQNSLTAAKNAKLAEENRNISFLKGKLRGALYSLPTDSGLPGFTDEASSVARFSQVHLTSIVVGSITAVVAAAPVSTTGTTGAASTSTAATPANPATAGTAAAAGGQYTIPVTVASTGSYAHQIKFLKTLQTGARRVLVNSSQVSVTGQSRTGSVDAATTMTTQLTLFSAPMSSAQVAQLKTILAAHS